MRSTWTTISWAPNSCQHYILRSWSVFFETEVFTDEALLNDPFDPYRWRMMILEMGRQEETKFTHLAGMSEGGAAERVGFAVAPGHDR